MRLRAHNARLTNLSRELNSERVPTRVHDVLVKGDIKAKAWTIEAELGELKRFNCKSALKQRAWSISYSSSSESSTP